MADLEIDTERIDEAVLGLMFLTLHSDTDVLSRPRAWKSFDWAALDRLHDKELIADPIGRAKSVSLTPEGRRRCEEAFRRLFVKRSIEAETD